MTEQYQNQIQDKRISALEEQFVKVCDHYNRQITNYNHQITKISVDMADMKANQRIIMWFLGVIVVALVGLFIQS